MSTLRRGDTFLTGDGDESNFHLWIVITPPTEGEVVTVCLVTAHGKSERLVVLNQGDHPFAQHESAIAYAYSQIRAVGDIEELLRKHLAKPREPVPPGLLKKIQDGLIDSDFTPKGVRAYYRQVMQDPGQ